MFRFLRKKAGFLLHAAKNHGSTSEKNSFSDALPLSHSFEENFARFKAKLGEGSDIIYHTFSLGEDNEKAAVIYIDGLVNSSAVSGSILSPILLRAELNKDERVTYKIIKEKILTAGEYSEVKTLTEAIDECLTGNTILIADGSNSAMSIGTKGWEKRGVEAPMTEVVVRGPREGFTESLRVNTTLIRRRIVTSDFRMETLNIGRRTKTSVCLAYIEGICDPKVLKTLKTRLSGLDVDAILDSGYIEEYIEDAPFSIFPTVSYSEKPDVIAARVLEGRVAIIVDGSPFVQCVPMLFVESFQTAEDYYIRFLPGTVSRIIRYIAFLITVYAPSLYIALTAFQPELLPRKLMYTIIGSSIGTPFPVIAELLFLLLVFELLRESGLRLPRPVGQAISIVGALTIGDAAVSAGLVGATAVITIAITTVTGFIIPEQNDSAMILRFIALFFTSILGAFGIILGMWFMMIHLTSLDSFGVPYYEGISLSSDFKDTIIRAPLWMMNKRPKDIAQGDMKRSRFFIPPLRPHAKREEENE